MSSPLICDWRDGGDEIEGDMKWEKGAKGPRGRGAKGSRVKTRALIARKTCKIEGDNRRKKFLGAMASVEAGMCWGRSQFWRFFVKTA